MRESVGTATLFEMIIGFTLLFAGFLAVAINYNKGFKLKNVLRTADRLVFLNKGPMSLEKRYFSPHLPEVIQQPDPPPHTRSILPGSGVSPIPSSKKKAPTYFLTFVRR